MVWKQNLRKFTTIYYRFCGYHDNQENGSIVNTQLCINCTLSCCCCSCSAAANTATTFTTTTKNAT